MEKNTLFISPKRTTSKIIPGNGVIIYSQTNGTIRSVGFFSRTVKLEPRLNRILSKLLQNPGAILSREELIEHYSIYNSNIDEALTLSISRLRKVFKKHNCTNLIETIPKIGYKINSDKYSVTVYNPLQVALPVFVLIAMTGLIGFLIFSKQDNYLPNSVRGLSKITNTETSYPSWSPNGEYFAVQSNRMDNNSEIYLISDDGKIMRRVTHHHSDDEYPSISPDGKKLLFTSQRDGNHEIYISDLDGSNSRNLSSSPAKDFMARWSHDSKSILYCTDRFGSLDIVRQDITDGIVHPVVPDRGHEKYANWSPDGKKILFARVKKTLSGEVAQIFIYDLETSKEYPLTNGDSYESWPSWNSDGTGIFYASNKENNALFQVYFMSLEDKRSKKITNGEDEMASFTKPVQSLDGSGRIACTRTKDGNVEIFLINQKL